MEKSKEEPQICGKSNLFGRGLRGSLELLRELKRNKLNREATAFARLSGCIPMQNGNGGLRLQL